MKIGITRFPGTNCDYDIHQMVSHKKLTPIWLWHKDQFDINSVDMVIIPGGFSYGDYLRTGALAARSNVMKSVIEFSKKGKPILGICNGFQILTESGLLPGALVQNESMHFIDKWVELKPVGTNPYFAKDLHSKIKLPVAHGDGRYFADARTLNILKEKQLIWWKYEENINGSVDNIAGVMNEQKNVCGMMPHPERALFDWMGGVDGWKFI